MKTSVNAKSEVSACHVSTLSVAYSDLVMCTAQRNLTDVILMNIDTRQKDVLFIFSSYYFATTNSVSSRSSEAKISSKRNAGPVGCVLPHSHASTVFFETPI